MSPAKPSGPRSRPVCVGDDGALLDVAEAVAADWAALGVRGSFLALNLDTGARLGFDVDEPVPLASVAKVPLALVVLDRIAAGELDAARPVTVDPARSSVGPTGLAAFRHPATVAVGDLLLLMLSVSDNAAADALFDLVPPARVDARLREWGCAGIRMRHRMNHMYECAAGAAGTTSRSRWSWPCGTNGRAGRRSIPWTRRTPTPARPWRSSSCCGACGATRSPSPGRRPSCGG
ncbi:serine hydrolase [Streptomyces sp. NPDC048106]|uniref:serine hydrolase n=1 Tax=Streptomyces sp. NPDC048106 TaxID=3155750 RepID=UPI00345243D3